MRRRVVRRRVVRRRVARRPVEPGDQLMLHATVERSRAGIVKFSAFAKVGDAIAVSAELMCTMRRVD